MTDSGKKEAYPWTIETMQIINKLTPDIAGKAFDPDWFLLRQRFEQFEEAASRLPVAQPEPTKRARLEDAYLADGDACETLSFIDWLIDRAALSEAGAPPEEEKL